MVPLCKQLCTMTRVLNLAERPPYDVEHAIEDYPLYYDPLYYPSCFLELFESAESVCTLLSTGACEHYRQCGHQSCTALRDSVHVRYNVDVFVFTFSGREVSVSVREVNASSFTYCRVFAAETRQRSL